MPAAFESYRSSGRTGQAWLLPIIGIASAAVSAFIYAWINVYSPVAGYISILFVALLAAGAALPIAFAGRLVKCRNKTVLMFNGLVVGVAAVYLAWVFFIYVFSFRFAPPDVETWTVWELFSRPSLVWGIATEIAAEGWYTLSSATPSGIVLWIFWTIEAAIVIGACIVLAPRMIDGLAFCEDCDRWMDGEESVGVPAESGSLMKAVKNGGLPAINEVEAPSEGASRWVQIDRQRCSQCKRHAVYRVSNLMLAPGKDGKPQAVVQPIIPLAIETDEDRAEIDRIVELLAAADRQRFESVKTKSTEDAAEDTPSTAEE